MKDIAEKRHGGHSMNRACERLCFSRQKIHLSLPPVLQVVLRRDLLEGSSSDPLLSPTPRDQLPSNVHMAHTDYKVISLSTLAPRRSCLLLVRPITGNYLGFPPLNRTPIIIFVFRFQAPIKGAFGRWSNVPCPWRLQVWRPPLSSL